MMTRTRYTCAAALILVAACAPQSEPQDQAKDGPVEDNTLLAEWTGPHGGVPAFDKMGG